MRTIKAVYVELNFDLEPLCGMELLAKFPECMFFIAYLIICGCKYTNLSTQQDDTFINAAVRMTCFTGKLFPKQLVQIFFNAKLNSVLSVLLKYVDKPIHKCFKNICIYLM